MDEYNALIKSTMFKQVEEFSVEWQNMHKATMDQYRQNWVADPLHWWSRQYEYPFHIARISNFLEGCPQPLNEQINILDVGTGTSFMPWHMLTKFPGLHITALDFDEANGRYHKEINGRYIAAGKKDLKTDFVQVYMTFGSKDEEDIAGPPGLQVESTRMKMSDIGCVWCCSERESCL